MNVTTFIDCKRLGGTHSNADIREFIDRYISGDIPDYQAAAWLMAVCWRGLDDDETIALTDAMLHSGETLNLSGIPGLKLDKHSTGGIGDKVTLAVVPLWAAAGIPVAKMSGRGLGYTGGTIDKLESIPGFRVSLTSTEISDTVAAACACICCQTPTLVPADQMLYSLRDVTATVESLPLIASSVMSKKIASGADAIVIDIKTGRGAFMKSIEQARELARIILKIGEAYQKKVHVTLTAMDIPLGAAVGNWLEVLEVEQLLTGKLSDGRLLREVVHIAGEGMKLAGKGDASTAQRLLANGVGWRKFLNIVKAQRGDTSVFETPRQSPVVIPVTAEARGYVSDIDALAIGRAAMAAGAGRRVKGDAIDPLAGIVIAAPVGSLVEADDIVAHIHGATGELVRGAAEFIKDAFRIEAEKPGEPALILDDIGASSND